MIELLKNLFTRESAARAAIVAAGQFVGANPELVGSKYAPWVVLGSLILGVGISSGDKTERVLDDILEDVIVTDDED